MPEDKQFDRAVRGGQTTADLARAKRERSAFWRGLPMSMRTDFIRVETFLAAGHCSLAEWAHIAMSVKLLDLLIIDKVGANSGRRYGDARRTLSPPQLSNMHWTWRKYALWIYDHLLEMVVWEEKLRMQHPGEVCVWRADFPEMVKLSYEWSLHPTKKDNVVQLRLQPTPSR
jgi:hypothetical protein